MSITDELAETVRYFLECPWIIDEASVPKAGIEKAPEQVVGNMSVMWIAIRDARALLKRYDEEKDK